MADAWETYELERSLLKEVPAVSRVNIDRAQRILGPHRHPAYEIVYVVSGSMDNWIDDRRYHIEAGEVFVTPPDTVHGGVDSVLHPNEHCLVHVALPRRGAPLPGMTPEDFGEIARDLAAMAPGVFPGSPEVPLLIDRLIAEHRSPGPYSRLLVRSTLHALLAQLARDHRHHAAKTETPEPGHEQIRAAIAWIDAHLDQGVALDALARRCGLSPSHFRRLFTREVGHAPAEYVARRRTESAKAMLSQAGSSITDIAMSLGYSSSQYFATVFKRYVGLTPKEWQRAQRSG